MSRRAQAFGQFLTDAKAWWMTEAFGALREEYQGRRAGQAVETPEQAAALVEDTPLYAYYAWLERHLQKAKYSGRWGLVPMAEQARPALLASLETPIPPELDPEVAVPDYYTVIDTHQHPGNLTGDNLAGIVYRGSAASTQPGSTVGYALHRRFAAVVAEFGEFRRIADLACGFGKSTLPLAQRFPAADVVGFDLSAPCLQLAAAEAAEHQVRNVAYRQRDAARTGAPAGSFDLVTSTMLLHELPTDAVHDVLAEVHRLLAPGGVSIHLDFRAEDPFLRFIHHGHGLRNNEPYMEAFDRMDVAAAHRDAELEGFAMQAFAESDGVLEPGHAAWRLPWMVFVSRKPL